MIDKVVETYQNYIQKIGDRYELYKVVAQTFQIEAAIYPGSHVDITPSFVIPKITYIDNFSGSIKFFADLESIRGYIDQHKDYAQPCEVAFLPNDYTDEMEIAPVDLIISQYAGFVGQSTKQYLKPGGIMLCNDSHGDATHAKMDADYEFLGVVENNENGYRINFDEISKYFLLPKEKQIDLNIVRSKMKGLKYSTNAENYVFRKIR